MTSTFRKITKIDVQPTWQLATTTSTEQPCLTTIDAIFALSEPSKPLALPIADVTFALHPLRKRRQWVDPDFRQGYMESSVEEGIAWQIKANREARKMTQAELANRMETAQSAISRLEDPQYGKHSLDTLIAVANAFDCALSVRLISYAVLAEESEDLSPAALYAESFEEQRYIIES